MNWKTKAMIQRGCARLPGGRVLYFLLQRHLGSLRQPRYLDRLRGQQAMAALMGEHGVRLSDAELMEVGTGWIPLFPVGFWLCGARRTRTLDIHRHLSPNLLRAALDWMCANRTQLLELWEGLVPPSDLRRRLETVRRLKDRPLEFMRQAGIEYRAPADAARTGLPDDSVDVHYSAHVFEHVPRDTLRIILAEAHRILRPGGWAVHLVDPTDHFAHTDPTITTVNHLRFEEADWSKYNNNPFGYQNRLRGYDYERLVRESPLSLVQHRFATDERGLAAIRAGLPLATPYRGKDAEQLCRCRLEFVMRKD